jgi:hypothetical protein
MSGECANQRISEVKRQADRRRIPNFLSLTRTVPATPLGSGEAQVGSVWSTSSAQERYVSEESSEWKLWEELASELNDCPFVVEGICFDISCSSMALACGESKVVDGAQMSSPWFIGSWKPLHSSAS